MSEKPKFNFRGISLPADIVHKLMDKEIKLAELKLLILVEALVEWKGQGCWAGNDRLAEILDLTSHYVCDCIQALARKGLLIILHKDGKRFLETCWSRTSSETSKDNSVQVQKNLDANPDKSGRHPDKSGQPIQKNQDIVYKDVKRKKDGEKKKKEKVINRINSNLSNSDISVGTVHNYSRYKKAHDFLKSSLLGKDLYSGEEQESIEGFISLGKKAIFSRWEDELEWYCDELSRGESFALPRIHNGKDFCENFDLIQKQFQCSLR